MSRLIMLLIIVSFLSLCLFGALLSHWWYANRDNFWIAISIYIFLLALCVMWFVTVKSKESDDDSEEHF